MVVTEVSVRYGRTVQPRQYESERVEVGLTATVGEGEFWVSVVHDLGIQAKDTVELQLRESELRESERLRGEARRQEQHQRRWGHPVPEDEP